MGEKMHDIFGPGSNLEERVFRDVNQLMEKIIPCRQLGLKLVLTSGVWDLFHIGHSRYLEEAKKRGNVLIVGVDSDEKVRNRKGPHRPVVGENERMEILCHCRHVDIVCLKHHSDPKWHFVKTVQPDVLIATRREYDEEDLTDLNDCCGEITVLESQATTSTTAKIRRALISPVGEIKERLKGLVDEICTYLDDLTGGEQ